MARLFIVDARGARSADLATARERFDDENKKVFGADLDTNDHTPQNQIAGINALVATEMSEEFVRSALYGSSISYAPGTFLDALGSLLDIRREQAAKSRVTARVTGVVGTLIPAGRLAKNSNGDTFESETDATIFEGGTEVGFIATDNGPIDVSAGSLNEIVSVVSGWEGITNENDGIVGRDRESDASYRATIRARTAHSSIGSLAALESALRSAGATRIRILENTDAGNVTKSGVTLPGHSILVIADGGRVDDIARAVENHRGMGVNTYSIFEGGVVDISQAQKITNGRMRFNNSTISGFNLSGQNLNGMTERLNNATTIADYTNSAGRILTLHSWNINDTGYSDVGGNISESGQILPQFVPVESKASGRLIYAKFPSKIDTISGVSFKYTSGGSETNATIASNGVRVVGESVLIQLTNSIPDNATDGKLSVTSLKSHYKTEPVFTDFPVDLEVIESGDLPMVPIVTGDPRDGGISVRSYALGTIRSTGGWEYKRFQDGSYLDSNWVNNNGTSIAGTRILNDLTITGFTNGQVGRIDIRARNNNGRTAAMSFTFTPTSNAPTLVDAHIDGNLVTLTYSDELEPVIIDSSITGWSFSSTGASNPSVSQINVSGRNAFLTLNSQTEEGDAWRLTNTQGVFAKNGVRTASFSNRIMTNDTLGGVPSAPIALVYTRSSSGYIASWNTNYDGGLSVDQYDISTRRQGSNVWSNWFSTGNASTSYSFATTSPPESIRVRASNPNARSAATLGLISDMAVVPFTRSIENPLSVSLSIYRNDDITTEDFDAIKDKLIRLVNSYDIGSRLWQVDLQAAVESIPSIRLTSSLTVTSNGVNVDGNEQTAYNRWTLAPDDIEVTFPTT